MYMDAWKIFLIKLAAFFVIVPLLGYAVLVAIEFIQKAWHSNNRRKKWIAMAIVSGAYLTLNGWFRR
jgi:hypothetical protein